MNIPIVYEDDWLVVVDKPAGLVTIPTPKSETRTLTSILNADLKEKGTAYRLHPCHRLDRETSGAIIYAKGKSVQRKMMEAFKQRKVNKTYIAFVQGRVTAAQGEIRLPIERQQAVTRYRLIEQRRDFSIIEAIPLTGRTNQIRIHTKLLGHPVVGETRFAFRRDFCLRAKRLCLHAASLEFAHPVTAKVIHIEVPLAEDLKSFLRQHPR